MANPFDQFDTPAPAAPVVPGAPATANPFDQFDVPAAPTQPKMDAAGDVGGGIVSGLVNAVTGLAGMPGTLQQLEGNLAGRGLDAMGFPGAAETARNIPFLPTGETLTGLAAKVMGPLYRKPETVPGQYAQSIAENAPGALVGPGGATRKLIEMIVPGVTAETAARVAPAGYEGAARLAGGLAGNVGTAAGAARMNAGDRAIVAATRGVEPDALRAGQPVLDTGRSINVDLSGPEGIQFATNNGTKLGDLQRVVEGSVAGGPTMAQFYANRPQQMRTAAENAFDTIAPQSAAPSTLGPRNAEAAQTAIDDVRQGINAQTRPEYAAAEAHVMDPADFAPIADQPAFRASLQRLRADPVLGPEIADLPNNSGRVIDLVTKDMGARSTALGASGEGFNPLLSERYASAAGETRDILRDPARGGVQAYDDALTAQAQARAQNLDPLTQGPVGALAGAGGGRGTLSGTQAAGDSILPAVPLTGGQGELADATARIGAIDPEGIAQLVRQRMADQYEHSATALVGGEAQGGGAKFAKDMAGGRTSQKQANIDAVLGALPNSPEAPQSVNTLLDTLRATGMRRPPGSNTAMDRELNDAMSAQGPISSILTAGKSAGLAIGQQVRDGARRRVLGGATSGLADLFTNPNSANMIADIVQRGVEPVYANALLRQALQAPGQINGGR